ncbi:hypothetical protein PFLUV_G00083440 [Perca fluviatilis]|uniref:VWFD domain-containing protein n=1 Tax=Perca fluviatilis TaxID=8168 RepID=A0A6A5FDM0_PERFL|nr:hypothetical protein PFLUV_G00083440 [Perca fluviatilis]
MTYIPANLLRGKIQVSYKEGKALLTTDFGMQVVFNGTSTVLVTLDPHYKGKVYGLCGNFNGDPQDEYPVTTPGSPPIKTSMELAQAYWLFDEDHNCCTGCKQGCFCNPGFISSQIGCVRPHQCGCTDSRGKYHSLHSTFWTPDNCGQVCICGSSAAQPSAPEEWSAGSYSTSGLDLTLSIYGLEVVVRKDDPRKVLVDGLYKPLPYSHLTGHVNAYRRPSSRIIHTDVGLQLIIHNTDFCSYDGHYSALCNSIASYAAACQAAQLPVRQWRRDTFCGKLRRTQSAF